MLPIIDAPRLPEIRHAVAEVQIGAVTIGGVDLIPAGVVLAVLAAVAFTLCLAAARRHDEADLRRRTARAGHVRAIRPGPAVAAPPAPGAVQGDGG